VLYLLNGLIGMLKRIVLTHKSLLAAQGGRCWICDRSMAKNPKNGGRNPQQRSLDHIIPRAKGGKGLKNNVLFAHQYCNSKRGDKGLTQDQWMKVHYIRLAAVAYELAG
jgi:5-methylcytosine-specific restriction endonuclease McrA